MSKKNANGLTKWDAVVEAIEGKTGYKSSLDALASAAQRIYGRGGVRAHGGIAPSYAGHVRRCYLDAKGIQSDARTHRHIPRRNMQNDKSLPERATLVALLDVFGVLDVTNQRKLRAIITDCHSIDQLRMLVDSTTELSKVINLRSAA